MKKVNICGYDDKGLYELSDEEVEYLENINKEIEEHKENILRGLGLPPYCFIAEETKIEELKVDEDKKVIIDQYKRQLGIISEVQEDLSIAFKNCEINIDEYMEGMCKTNDRAMAIINQLKIESEYIPF